MEILLKSFVSESSIFYHILRHEGFHLNLQKKMEEKQKPFIKNLSFVKIS